MPGSVVELARCAWYRRWIVDAAMISASGRLSLWRFRVRMLRCEGVEGSREADLSE